MNIEVSVTVNPYNEIRQEEVPATVLAKAHEGAARLEAILTRQASLFENQGKK